MQRHGVDACLMPSADPHLSEYLPEHWQIRRWLTGFTGSVGTVVVTQVDAHLWVDSRYWVQAERELAGSGFELRRIGVATDPGPLMWVSEFLQNGQCLAVDGRTLSLSAHAQLISRLADRVSVRLDLDLPGEIWDGRPNLPAQPIKRWPDELAGRSRADKLAMLREQMIGKGATHHLVSSLDDIAWLLNLRGSDVPFNPVFLAHLLVSADEAMLFVDQSRLDAELIDSLRIDGVSVAPYDSLPHGLRILSQTDTLWVDPTRVASAYALTSAAKRIESINFSTLAKACKDSVELDHWREVMAVDGAALCEFFAWLDDAIAKRHEQPLTELMIDEQVCAARAKSDKFLGPSFATIAAFNANGAMPHYRATETAYAQIEGNGLLLIDSGGQYLGGTTDITRMVPVGDLTAQQICDCTLVLKAMIALSQLQFPKGIAAPLIDAVARANLWQHGLDYGHGTGHGVGYGLNVHEGPQVLSYRAPIHPNMALQPGMVTSNEPGLYRPGKWGVRIENLVCAQPGDANEFGEFLRFETLTLCPIDLRCIDLHALTTNERQWVNDYHSHVRQRLAPRLEERGLQWLVERTERLPL
ncbi:MAG: aminopeptidase P family protein [Burkholderiaceae bacterium]|nr:aminopeptidase P family protein [Burkholderiaceae bacterium]MCD8565545.1 aminopeptidase P family protein [Burkholderiaceae bacterium]